MHADLARLDLRTRRRGLWAYTLGMAAYAGLIVILYPSFQHDTSLDTLAAGNPSVAALLGISGSLTTPSGWMDANVYSNFLPLVLLLVTIGYGAAAIAGQDEDGTLGLLATLPLGRRSLTLQKLVALTAVATPVAVATSLVVLAGRRFQVTLEPGPLLATTAALVVLGVDFGLLALFIGALTGSRSTALGIGTSVAALSYVLSSLAPTIHWIHRVRWVSPFYWAVGNGQLTHGVSPASATALVATLVLLLGACLWAVDRFDIH